MSYWAEGDCLQNDHTHVCMCTDSHKQTHTHTGKHKPTQMFEHTHTKPLQSPERAHLMSSKSQGWRNCWGFKNLLLCSRFAKFPPLRHQYVNNSQTFQEVTCCNVWREERFLLKLAVYMHISLVLEEILYDGAEIIHFTPGINMQPVSRYLTVFGQWCVI